MDLFDSKDVLHAATLTAKLYPEEADPIAKATLNAIGSGGDIPSFHLAAYIGGFARNAENYLRYGKDKYLLGLPEGTMGTMGVNMDDALTVIRSIERVPVTIVGGFVGGPVLSYFVYEYLRNLYDWDFKTNLTRPLSLPPVGNKRALKLVNYYIERNQIKVRLQYAPTGTQVPTGTPVVVTLNIGPAPDKTKTYTHIQYYLKSDGPDKLKFWTYDHTTNKYPILNKNLGTPISSPFYPIAPLRLDKKFYDTPGYEKGRTGLSKSVKALLKKIHLKPEDLVSAIKGPDPEYDANGKQTNKDKVNTDLGDMDDAYFAFALDIYTEVEASIEYFHAFFTGLALGSVMSKSMYEQAVAKRKADASKPQTGDVDNHGIPIITGAQAVMPTNKLIIKEGDDFQMQIKYNYIEHTAVVNGALANKFEREIVIKPKKTFALNEGFDDGGIIKTYVEDTEQSYIIFKKRLTKTTYTQILVHGLEHKVAVSKAGQRKVVTTVLETSEIKNPKGDSGLFIPLAYDVIDDLFDRIDREIVLYDGMMVIVMAGKIETLKWYQRGFFKFLITIAVFVLTVFLTLTFGPATMTLSQAVFQVLGQMALAWTLSIVVELLVKHLGDLGAVLAVVLMVFIAFKTGQFDLGILNEMPTAMEMLDAVSGAVTSITNIGTEVYTQVSSAALEEEYLKTLQEIEDKQAELDEAESLLPRMDNPYDPLFVMKASELMLAREKPGDYYSRLLTNNPGVLTLDIIKEFHTNALTLPPPNVGALLYQ